MRLIDKTREEMVVELEELKRHISRLERQVDRNKRTEKKIKNTVKEWETTFDSINDMVSIHDDNLKLIRVNHKFAENFKKKPQELIGKKCYEVFHAAGDAIDDCPYKKMKESRKSVNIEYYEPNLGMDIEVTISPLINGRGNVIGCVHIARNISERKRIEENMLITDRLASIGELVAGIAHEVNNPLTSVIGYLEIMLGGEVPERMKEDMAIAHHEAMRAAKVVGGLLNFTRKHAPEKKLVNINGIIAAVLRLRGYEQRVHNIRTINRLARDLPMTMADAFQIQQVFLNLIMNAEYFMSEAHGEGKLIIATENVNNMIRISFIDDGPGIPEKNMEYIFDPFFTTKEEGKGTGLGLSICQGIIAKHNGKICVVSEPGKGTSFIIELPIITGEEELSK